MPLFRSETQRKRPKMNHDCDSLALHCSLRSLSNRSDPAEQFNERLQL